MKILVTGGAGYIGSHAVKELCKKGYRVYVLDNLVYGHKEIVEKVLQVPLIIGDIGDRKLLRGLFSKENFGAIMHFSAYAYVGESVEKPIQYYQNNFSATLNLVEEAIAHNIRHFVFSSTCASYGIPEKVPIEEDFPQRPINPYGYSKLMVEQMLQDLSRAEEFYYTIFRYFNAAGADPDGNLGEDHDPETHLIPLILLSLLGKRGPLSIFGTDYPTPDGTCIRDYIHVTDLAEAHILGLERMIKAKESDIFNLGNGRGFSIREVIEAAQRVTGRKLRYKEAPRRPGDPPILVGSAKKAQEILGWKPRFYELESILETAWQWTQKRFP